jgi:hypothetical protein
MGMLFNRDKQDARKNGRAQREHFSPFKLASYEHDHEGKKFKSGKVIFSFWSATKYVFILSLVLWWLPMFGQMIAGYVGGRRAGGPWKGVVASILPVVCIYAVVTAFETGLLPSHVLGVAIAPAAIGASLNQNIPLVSPYLSFSSEYVGAFVNGLAGASPYGINTYVLTVAFAYVGGILAEQSRREIEFTAGAVSSNTTVLVHDPQAHLRAEMPVQVEPVRAGGIIAGLSGLLHRNTGGEPVAVMTSAHRRHRDPWAYAADMRYREDAPIYDDRYALPSADEMQMRDPYGYGGYQSRNSRNQQMRNDWRPKHKRRGRPNFSAKPRFRYPKYEDQEGAQRHDNNAYSGGWRRSGRSSQNFAVASNPKSIRRVRKMIDNEWGGRSHSSKYPRFERESATSADEEPVERPHRKEHNTGHNWDSI